VKPREQAAGLWARGCNSGRRVAAGQPVRRHGRGFAVARLPSVRPELVGSEAEPQVQRLHFSWEVKCSASTSSARTVFGGPKPHFSPPACGRGRGWACLWRVRARLAPLAPTP